MDLTSVWQQAPVKILLGSAAYSAFLVAIGVLHLFYGWRIYRITFTAFCVLLGGALGAHLALRVGWPWPALALPAAVVAGLLCLWIERFLVFLTVGTVCALALNQVYAKPPDTMLYVAAGLAFLLGGLLGALLWRPLVILCQALLGAALILSAVLLTAGQVRPDTAGPLLQGREGILLLIVLLTAIPGAIFQMVAGGAKEKEDAKKKLAAAKATRGKGAGRGKSGGDE